MSVHKTSTYTCKLKYDGCAAIFIVLMKCLKRDLRFIKYS